jgi:transcription-repair coupling factor (superfamily II helicase)
MILYTWVFIHYTKFQNTTGKDGTPPKIYKLGSNAWKVLKQNQGRVKHFNLIQLYAKRRLDKVSSLHQIAICKLESSFIYEDTPDQIYSRGQSRYGVTVLWTV